MEISRQIEILELVIECLNKPFNRYKFGICTVLIYLSSDKIIRLTEANKIKIILFENKPSKDNDYSEFMVNQYWDNATDGYWWQPINEAPETRQIRIDYLRKLISNIK